MAEPSLESENLPDISKELSVFFFKHKSRHIGGGGGDCFKKGSSLCIEGSYTTQWVILGINTAGSGTPKRQDPEGWTRSALPNLWGEGGLSNIRYPASQVFTL